MTHTAIWSRLLIVVSILASAVLVGVAVIIWRNVREPMGGALATLSILVLLGGLLFSIRSYRLDGAHLYVRRPFWETDVDLRELRSVKIDPGAMKGSIRLFGNGGLFSFSGFFRNRKLGRYRAFVTDPGRAVILRFPSRTVVVSPEDPRAFVADILGRNPRVHNDRVGASDEEA